MKKITVLLLCVVSVLGGCSKQDSNVELIVGTSPNLLIPASARSCALAADADPDIAPLYFRIPRIRLTRKDATKEMEIAQVRIKIPVPGSSTVITCLKGGQDLAGLVDTWTLKSPALIAAGVADFTTTCPLYCGGIEEIAYAFVASGTIEVIGVERSEDGFTETPVRAQSTITVENVF